MAYRSTNLNEVHEELKRIAYTLVGGLPGWVYAEPDERSCYHKLIGPDEATLYLSIDGDTKGDRLRVSGGFHIGKTKYGNPEYVRPNTGDPGSMTMAIARGPEAIVRTVSRYVQDKYLPALAQAIKQRDEAEAYLQAKLSNLQHLQSLAGDTRTLARDAERGYLHIGEAYGHIEATDDSERLDLRCLTIKQAEDIINLLRRKS